MAITGSYWGTAPSLGSQQPGWVTPSAADLSTPPASLDPESFRAWKRADQVAYVQAHGGGTLEIGPPLKAVTVAIAATNAIVLRLPDLSGQPGDEFSVQSVGRAATATELSIPVALLDPKVFMAWNRADQVAYVEANGTGNPRSVTLGGAPLLPGDPDDPDQPGPPRIFASAEPDVVIHDGVIAGRSSGDYEPRPYFFLPGSAVGSYSATIAETARRLFPALDGAIGKIAVENRPDTFYITPDLLVTEEQTRFFLDSFARWHSALQLEYVKTHGDGGVLDIPLKPDPVGSWQPQMTAVVSASDPARLFIVQSLQKQDFARMTAAEQRQIAETDAFLTLGPALGLVAATDPAVALLLDRIDTLIDTIENRPAHFNATAVNPPSGPFTPGQVQAGQYKPNDPTQNGQPARASDGGILKWEQEGFTNLTVAGPTGDVERRVPVWVLKSHTMAPFPDDAKAAFIAQLNILKEQIATMGVISPAEIQRQSSELEKRFDRAFAFFDVKAPQRLETHMGHPSVDVPVFRDVISQDGDLAGIRRGFQIFIQQERQVAALAEARMQAARDSGLLYGRSQDAAALVFLFQELYSRSIEAAVVSDTEEINQQNDLLKTYAAMQDVINRTLGAFPKASDERKRLLGGEWNDYADYPNSLRMLLGMFEDHIGNGQLHPLERLDTVPRPVMDFIWQVPTSRLLFDSGSNYDLNRRTHMQWDIFNQRLAETIAMMNQNTQIKMNDLNSLEKQQNRHFELANNALGKMYEMLDKIARI